MESGAIINEFFELLEEDEDPNSIDNLLSSFKFGKYFRRSSLIVGLGMSCDGNELVLISILNVIYQNKFNFSSTSLSALISCIFFGLLVGSFVSGYISDRLGRKNTMALMLLALYIPNLLTLLTVQTFHVFIFRSMIGFFMGIYIPVAMSYFTEITPLEYRANHMIMATGYWILGSIFCAFVAFLIAQSVEEVDWKLLIIIAAQPMIISSFLVIFYVEESPRYLLLVKKSPIEFRQVMRSISIKNESDLSDDKIEKTINWSIEWIKKRSEQKAGILDLFSKENIRISGIVASIWLCVVYSYYSIYFLAPMLRAKGSSKTSTFGLFMNNLGEIFSIFLSFYLVEHPKFGRNSSISFGFKLSIPFLLLMPFLLSIQNFHFLVWCTLTILRIVLALVFVILEVLTGELFNSQLRAVGVGFAHSVGRLAGMIIAPVNLELIAYNQAFPFFVMILVCIVGIFALSKIQKDTRGPIH